MSIQLRNNVRVSGNPEAARTIVFAHGFGCDQTMWNYLTPMFADDYRIVSFDLVGSGQSDADAYDKTRYGSLHGYAADLLEIVEAYSTQPAIFVGHSVSAMIGLLAANAQPARFAAQIMVSPSPCYIDDGDYVGGFSRADIDDLLLSMDSNYLGWSSSMAPAIMGPANGERLGQELTGAFCRNDPEIARHFASVTFLSDHRADLAKSSVPALILQCNDDFIAPQSVGAYMHARMPDSVLAPIDNVGHCPHMSAPEQIASAVHGYLAPRGW